MKCRIVKMRRAGVVIPKYDLKNQYRHKGELEIVDTRENNLNRIVKLARLIGYLGDQKRIEILYEPHLLWMSDTRFVLTGFEQILQEAQITDYAQSWLCDTRADEW